LDEVYFDRKWTLFKLQSNVMDKNKDLFCYTVIWHCHRAVVSLYNINQNAPFILYNDITMHSAKNIKFSKLYLTLGSS